MIARVLIVDDHALVATVLRFALRERGWSVETAAGVTADEVVEHARGFRPRCVLLDTRLGPTTIGIELIAPLRASGAEVVMLTAETEPAVLAAFLEAGAAGWISKHDALDDVEAALNKVHAGVALIGRGRREAMLAELRSQRASRRLTLSPFERMTTCGTRRARRARRRSVRRGDRRVPLRCCRHRALPHPRGAQQARRPLPTRRCSPRHPRRLGQRPRSRRRRLSTGSRQSRPIIAAPTARYRWIPALRTIHDPSSGSDYRGRSRRRRSSERRWDWRASQSCVSEEEVVPGGSAAVLATPVGWGCDRPTHVVHHCWDRRRWN